MNTGCKWVFRRSSCPVSCFMPVQRISWIPLSRVITLSPAFSSSTGISPRGVAISVPGVKQGMTFSILTKDSVPVGLPSVSRKVTVPFSGFVGS